MPEGTAVAVQVGDCEAANMSALLLLFYLILFIAYVWVASVAIVRVRRRAKAEPEFKGEAWMRTVLWLLPGALIAYGPMKVLYLDVQMKRLCAKDGGVRIYEVVMLPKENFGPNGEVFPQYRTRLLSDGRFGDQYQLIASRETLVSGSPALTRFSDRMIRKSDGKLLGESVSYSRGSWALAGPWETGGAGCPILTDPKNWLTPQLFKRQEQ